MKKIILMVLVGLLTSCASLAPNSNDDSCTLKPKIGVCKHHERVNTP